VSLTRRQFLSFGAAAAALGLTPHQLREALAQTAGTVARPAGTTFESAIAAAGEGAYVRLTDGPGYPLVVRSELAEPKAGREARRVSLASVVHVTDVHVIDAQSPARVEFVDRYSDGPGRQVPFSSAYRPQETLTCHVGESMVQRIRSLGRGPVTGRRFDCAVSTGDNTDNQQLNELEWFLTLLDGGRLTPNSGGPAYEGVMDMNATTFDVHYWHPDDERADADLYRAGGFPAYPGLLDASVRPFDAAGLGFRWYSVHGNHDGLLQGNVRSNAILDAIAAGPLKVVGLPPGVSPADAQRMLTTPGEFDPALLSAGPARPVTPDEARRTHDVAGYIRAHLEAAGEPRGHGLTEDNLGDGTLHYTFDAAPGVAGIALDTVNLGGYADGSIGVSQLTWLEDRLREASTRWYEADGTEVRNGSTDKLVVLFSHHNLYSMENPFPDPARPDDPKVNGAAIEEVLHRYPNVVAWVNGHSHRNLITPRPDPAGRTQGFWEIMTAAHVDHPEQARIVEVVNNADGTLSVFATLIEHAAPASTTVGATDPLGLASISRELAFNDPQHSGEDPLGPPESRNAELVLAAPFDLGSLTSGGAAEGTTTTQPQSGVLPATGLVTPGIAVAGTAVAGALALRRRLDRLDKPENPDIR
jgi:metallophosphoesterase (TIGR03767 family)